MKIGCKEYGIGENEGELPMNFKHLDRLIMASFYDEIKVIGRDVNPDGHYAHIIGLTLKEKHAFVYGNDKAR